MTLTADAELTEEEKKQLRESKLRFIAKGSHDEYDPDCPPITPEQAAEFYPANGAWEERAARMRKQREQAEQPQELAPAGVLV